MLPFQIKICGVTRAEDARNAFRSGADAIGLNFFPASKRYVSPDEAGSWLAQLREQPEAQGRRVVGVFVNHPTDELLRLATELRLDGVQFHGDEQPDQLTQFRQHWPPDAKCPTLIRACRVGSEAHRSIDSCLDEIQAWSDAGANCILLDAAAPGVYGGSGHRLDWTQVPRLQTLSPLPIALAGGLTPENVAQAIGQSGVGSVDVASGVESSPGLKSDDKVRQFVQSARQAFSDRASGD